jgi:anti-sigma-K factor RskA
VTGCGDARVLLGSYVLGGLDADETAIVEEHLRTCADCREAHARLASLPPLLDLVDPQWSAETAPAPLLEQSVLARFAASEVGGDGTKRDGRRRASRSARWKIAAASAVGGAALTLAVLALAGTFSSDGAAEMRVRLAPATGRGTANAQARLVSTRVGTEVDLDADLPRLRAGEIYELWFGRGDGIVSAGTFTVDDRGWAHVHLTTAARVGGYERLGITREPDGADPARNGPAVVVGALPR